MCSCAWWGVGTPLDQNRSTNLLELELQPGPLQEQQALLAADPSLQPLNVYVDIIQIYVIFI